MLAGGVALAGITYSSEFTEFAGFGPRSLAFLSAAAGITGSAMAIVATVMAGLRRV
jgi:hypothetical protein